MGIFFEIKAANVREAKTPDFYSHPENLGPVLTTSSAYACHFFHDDIVGANAIDRIPFDTTPSQNATGMSSTSCE